MSAHLRSRLSDVLDDLGRTLLDVVATPGHLDGEVTGVAIYGPVDELVVTPGELVLGVGVQDPAAIAHLLRRLGAGGAVGLVVKLPVAADEEITTAVAESGVPLLGLTTAVSWAQVAALLRAVPRTEQYATDGPDDPAGVPAGDVFSLAHAVAALLDAPVTIDELLGSMWGRYASSGCGMRSRCTSPRSTRTPPRRSSAAWRTPTRNTTSVRGHPARVRRRVRQHRRARRRTPSDTCTPDTFRYRLRRLCQISGRDLGDPEARLAATLQLRLHRLVTNRP